MNKKEFIYETPEVKVMEVLSEGVLCASTMGADITVKDWEDGEFSW